jgi:tetratricopeptide (TPR) repeat protein
MAFGEYYKKFLQAREMKSNLKDTKIPFEVPHSVNEDWEYRVQQLTRPEKKLLNCCCVFPGEPIPWGIFSVQPNTFGATNGKPGLPISSLLRMIPNASLVNGLEEAMMKLVSRNLISCNENYQYVIANELIAEWHLGRLDQKEKVAAAKRAWQCIASFAKNTSTKAGDGLSSSLTQKEAVSLVADSSASTREDLSWFQLSAQNWVDLAELCRRRGHYTAADKFGDCAYRKLQDGNPSKKTMLRLLGIYLEMKATLKAETLWGTIASLRTAVPRKDLKEYEAQNLLEIRLKYQCGNIDEAIDLAKHYIIHLEDREGPVDALTLSTLKVLASFLIEKGNYEMADPIMHRLLLSYESIYGPNDPITTEALERLGFLFVAQGKFDDAEKSYARAKRQNEQRLGLDHPTTQVCAAKLAAVYNRQGRHNESLELYRSALESMQDWFGPQHPDVIKIRISRAEVYMAQREFELAAKDYSNVLIASESMDESIAMLLSSLKIESATVATQLHFALTEAGQLAEARGIAEKYHIQPET